MKNSLRLMSGAGVTISGADPQQASFISRLRVHVPAATMGVLVVVSELAE